MEPLRVAHRLDPRRTWLFSARFDQVVPAVYGRRLAAEIGLDCQHHRHFAGCHYSCFLSAPRFLAEMRRAIPRSVVRNSTGVAAPQSYASPVGWQQPSAAARLNIVTRLARSLAIPA